MNAPTTGPAKSTGKRVTAIVAAIVVLAGIVAGALLLRPGANTGQVAVRAIFETASPLVPGNEVKSAGVVVGSIVDIRLEGDRRAVVDMLVDRSLLPIHGDAQAVITPKDILGERFVDLQRGTPTAPTTAEPITIPVERTSVSTDIQSVLNAFDDPTSEAVASMTRGFGQGLDGKGAEAAEAVRALSPAMQRARDLATVLDSQNAVLNRLIETTEPVTAELAANRGQKLDRLVGATEGLLSVTGSERAAVAASLQQLPGTLQNARRTLREVAGVAGEATPALASIRPVTDDLTKIDAELRRFADSLDPALASLPPVLDRAKQLIDEARPLVANDLKPLGPDLRAVTKAARPLSERGVSLRIENLMKFIKFWAMSTSGYDGVSHYFRATVPLTPQALCRSGVGNANLVLPGGPSCDGGPIPMPAGATGAAAGGLPSVPTVAGRGATGLTSQQENSMLGQLMGGR